MRLVSNLLDGLIVYLSRSCAFKTPALDQLLAQHGAVVALHVNSRVHNPLVIMGFAVTFDA